MKLTVPSEPAELADYFWRSLMHDAPRVREELRKLLPYLGDAAADEAISRFLQTFWLPEAYRFFAVWELSEGVPELPKPVPPASWSSPTGADNNPHRKAATRALKRVRDAVKENIQPLLQDRLGVVLNDLDAQAVKDDADETVRLKERARKEYRSVLQRLGAGRLGVPKYQARDVEWVIQAVYLDWQFIRIGGEAHAEDTVRMAVQAMIERLGISPPERRGRPDGSRDSTPRLRS